MFNIFEMIKSGSGEAGPGAIGKAFGLDASATGKAIDALLPAFAEGMKQTAARSGEVLTAMGELAGKSIAPEPDPPPKPVDPGEALIAAMFGRGAGAQKVAQLAASSSGLEASVLQAMLPSLASAMMAGLARQAESVGMAGLMPKSAPKPDPVSQFFAMMSAGMPGAMPAAPATPDAADLVRQGYDSFAQMIETGRQVQQEHVAGMQRIMHDLTPEPDKEKP